MNASQGMVSVLMPAYNAEKCIEQAIKSVLSQTYPHFELLIMDDGSWDTTGRICDEFAALDGRVRVIHQKNKGVWTSANTLLKTAQYELVAFLDSDDMMLPNRLEKQVHFLNSNPELAFAGSYIYLLNKDGKIYARRGNPLTTHILASRQAALPNIIWFCHSSMICKRDVLLRAGGFPEAGYASDTYLWNILARKTQFLIQPEYLTAYRVHRDSISIKKSRAQKIKDRWTKDSLRRLLNGQEMLSWTSYQELEQVLPKHIKLAYWLSDSAEICYRQAGISKADGNLFKSWGWAFLSCLLWPPMVLHKFASIIKFEFLKRIK